LCFIRKATTLHDKILDQLKTILDRDLRQIYSSQLTFDVIHEFLAEIAMNEGRLFHYQDYRKKTGLSPITQKKLLYAFEAIFLIRRIPVEGGKRGFTLLLEDQAESNFLSGSKKSTSIELMGLLYRNLRAECFYQTDKPIQVFQFTTRTGKTVPLGFRNDQFSVGFVLTESDQISREQRGVASSFLKHYANSKIIFVSQGRKLAQIDERSMLCPLSCLL
jgi:predicted AAA+ superfamily ATPase